jgi:hypothetical protein
MGMPLGKPGDPGPSNDPKAPLPSLLDLKPPGKRPSSVGTVLMLLAVGLVLAASCGGLALLVHRNGWSALKGMVAVGLLVQGIRFLRWATRPARRAAVKRFLGLARGVKELARRLDVPEEDLRGFAPSYREVRVPKKRGGTRLLHVPDDRTKALQRRILHRLLARMESHDAAYGFERGRSIAHNAAQHVGRALVLRFDVVDFFPATRSGRIERMFLRFGWSAEAAALLVRLTTHGDGLPQGAPTSPRLSNLVNAGLDATLTRWIGRRRGRYTRYADDVTVSFPEDWIGEPERTFATVQTAFSRRGYRLHGKEKTSVRRRHQRQVVNGLVVNRKVQLPRRLRRLLRAARHRAATGKAATLTPEQLEGWAAFEGMVRLHGAETPPPWKRTSKNGITPRRRP